MKRGIIITVFFVLFSQMSFGQDKIDSLRPSRIVTIAEFNESLSDRSRSILLRTASDSLVGPIQRYENSSFLLYDSFVIHRQYSKEIVEDWTYAGQYALYGAAAGFVIGAVIGAVLSTKESSSGDNSQGQVLVPAFIIIGGGALFTLPGLITGAIIGSNHQRGYHFPIDSLEVGK